MSIASFRAALRKARQHKGWTVEQAAQAIAVPANTYKSYERRGGRVPPMDLVKPITTALGPGPVNALLEGSGHVCYQNGQRDVLVRLAREMAETFLAADRGGQGEK